MRGNKVTCIHRQVPEECVLCGEFPLWLDNHKRWMAQKDRTMEDARRAFWRWLKDTPWGQWYLQEYERQRGVL